MPKMLPQETLLDILAHLSGRDFDVLELVNRALGSLIAAKFDDVPRRVISLMFYEEHVMLTCPWDGWRHVAVMDMPQYLPRSVIAKMVFKSTGSTFTEEAYQALLPCRAHFAADVVCDFHSLSLFPLDILHRALTEVFICNKLIFAEHSSHTMHDLCGYMGEQDLTALPCFASCANLQIAHYDDAFFDANGALEWLLGTHTVAAGVKHLYVGVMDKDSWNDFLRPFIAAVEQQFIQATTPASFNVELSFFVGHGHGPNFGRTRERKNTGTNERLTVDVDMDIRHADGEPVRTKKVTIQRKPTA
ncbi:hypothetical protein AAVH_19688 [Aphelenchoides avenae]|nr:hypothetical protein AAVH_19688 [Aphelenchus avenae]